MRVSAGKMTGRDWLTGAAGALMFLLLFVGCVWFFFPMAPVKARIEALGSDAGLTVTAASVSKKLLPGLVIKSLVVKNSAGELLTVDRLDVSPSWLSLCAFSPEIGMQARLAGGTLELSQCLTGSHTTDLEAAGIDLAKIPALKTILSAGAKGQLSLHGQLKNSVGELKLELKEPSLTGLSVGGMSLPDIAGKKSQGLIKVAKGQLELVSLNLDDVDSYTRVTGTIPLDIAGQLKLKADFMPKPALLERQKLIFMALTGYQVSPGVYSVPISGTLLSPQLPGRASPPTALPAPVAAPPAGSPTSAMVAQPLPAMVAVQTAPRIHKPKKSDTPE